MLLLTLLLKTCKNILNFLINKKVYSAIFLKFIPYFENFNKLQEKITKKAGVNFDCKCYKLIKCKPSL